MIGQIEHRSHCFCHHFVVCTIFGTSESEVSGHVYIPQRCFFPEKNLPLKIQLSRLVVPNMWPIEMLGLHNEPTLTSFEKRFKKSFKEIFDNVLSDFFVESRFVVQ